jgi:Arc/MetJ-type ribon-helix-helix transcriptional regulator
MDLKASLGVFSGERVLPFSSIASSSQKPLIDSKDHDPYYLLMTKTISLRLDQRLLHAIEVARKTAHKDRSEVVSEALELWLKQRAAVEKVRRHREGYARHPIRREEFAPVLKAQTWPK